VKSPNSKNNDIYKSNMEGFGESDKIDPAM